MIASSGALTCWLATYLFLPRLLRHVDRGRDAAARRFLPARPAAVALPVSPPHSSPETRAHARGLAGADRRGAICATRLDGSRIEYDMSKLRNRESRRTGEGYWGPQMDALLGRNFTAVAFMTDSAAQPAWWAPPLPRP